MLELVETRILEIAYGLQLRCHANANKTAKYLVVENREMSKDLTKGRRNRDAVIPIPGEC